MSWCTHTAVMGLQGGKGWSAFYRGGAVFVLSQSTLKLRQGLAQAKQEEELVPLGGNPGSACFGQLRTGSVNQGTFSGQPNLSTPEIRLC